MSILVLGCGRVGSGLARELTGRGRDVTVVDVDADALERLGTGFRGEVVHGSALDRHVLVRAGIRDADGVAGVTGSDSINATVTRAARLQDHVPVVVARLYDPRKAEIYDRLGVRTIAPVTWGIRRIADLLTASEVQPIAGLGTGEVEVIDVTVPTLLAGRTGAELEIPGEIQVIAVTRHGRTFLASTAVALEAGDLVHLAVAAHATGRLSALLGHQ